jgi:hypothetical protein
MAYIQNGFTLGELAWAMENAARVKSKHNRKRMDVIMDCLNNNLPSNEYEFPRTKHRRTSNAETRVSPSKILARTKHLE